jgi:hypothetical protein
MLWKYYGVDWAVFVLIVLHLWLLGNRNRFAFILGALGTCFGFAFGILIGSLASVLMNVVFFTMHVRAFFKWAKPEQCDGPQLAEGTWPDEGLRYFLENGKTKEI